MTLEDLRQYGANVEEGVTRCAGNEAFYLRLAEMIKNEPGFDRLEKAVLGGQLREAFEAAHSLKGVLGNLAITPLYEPMCEITELLRAETETDYSGLLGTIRQEKEKYCAL